MSSVNKAILIGNLGRDPEVRTTQNGERVVSFSLATTESWRDKASGERKDRTEWHNVVIWNDAIGKVGILRAQGVEGLHRRPDSDARVHRQGRQPAPRDRNRVAALSGRADVARQRQEPR